ncbi:MAG: GNAT family N-acetyltransferase [Gracilibacteraceae bacterium]|jgi:RimJ/RimL family protein N-acetyltransferase|nr:GNAT family N-acetyltransferase [Gracilibacteraceae bacterium]
MITGKNTSIRPLEPEDIDTLYTWHLDPEFSFWLSGSWPERMLMRREDVEQIFYVEDPYRYAILNESRDIIGTIGFDQHNIPARSARLFLGIGDKTHWNQGYGTDALLTFSRYLFEQWNLHRLSLETWAGNLKALRCYEKAGFQREGVLKDAYYIKGSYNDGIILAKIVTMGN